MAREQKPLNTGIDWGNPFSRLAGVHLTSVAGEALLAISLAGSLFFDVDPSDGRQKVLLGLLLTMTPFALIGPLIGPMLNRVSGGHRATIIATMGVRCLISVAMIFAVASDSLLLFPAAFLMLVLGKTYQIVKASAVPSTVSSDQELVEANSKLQLLSGAAGVLAGIPGVIALQLGAEFVSVLTAFVFGVATVGAVRLDKFPVDPIDTPEEEEQEARGRIELSSTPVVAASTAMAVLRMIVGFTTFLMAFELRAGDDRTFSRKVGTLVLEEYQKFSIGMEIPELSTGPPAWHFGVVLGMSVLGGIAGAGLAPRLRQRMEEERIMFGAIATVASVSGLAILFGGLIQYVMISGVVAIGAATAKQAFDSLVQQNAPDAERGQLFAKFETRFQIAWVFGAILPAALHIAPTIGAIFISVCTVAAGVFFYRSTNTPASPDRQRPRRDSEDRSDRGRRGERRNKAPRENRRRPRTD